MRAKWKKIVRTLKKSQTTLDIMLCYKLFLFKIKKKNRARNEKNNAARRRVKEG
jgi:hypothetical protein